MVVCAKKIFSLFVLIICSAALIDAAKLNYPRVLLPIFEKTSVNFTLEVIEKSCYKWTASRQDLIQITPVYDDPDDECSSSAIVTVLTRERRRNTAIVFAEDLSSGEALRCDVIVDIIDRLNVRTTTRQLYLEEAPETFELHAFDAQGNEFSTLEGVQFDWELSAPSQRAHIEPALRFLTFTDSPYHDVPAELEQFEARGIRGYKVLLEGINTGTSKVRVSMPYAEYTHVEPIQAYISVLANIIIEPSELYMLPGDTIELRLLQLKMGKLHEVSLNNQYYFHVEQSDVASIKGNAVSGQQLGHTTIYLRDRNVPEGSRYETQDTNGNGTELRAPSAELTVTNPTELKLRILPHNSFITTLGSWHELAFDLYSSDKQRITLGSRYNIDSQVDSAYFHISKRTKNGSRILGEASNVGSAQIYGAYKSLTVQGELEIYTPLELQPQRVVLPLDANVKKSQKLQFHASGGDRHYVWSSGNARLLNVNSLGLATTVIREQQSTLEFHDASSHQPLHTHVRVALAKNQKVMRQAEVLFLAPVRLAIKRYNFETALNDVLQLHIAIYAELNGSELPYTQCEQLSFEVQYQNEVFKQEPAQGTDFAEHSCHIVQLRSTIEGIFDVTVSYNFQGKFLQDSVQLYVFKPLSIVQPSTTEVVLPLGASRNIVLGDGPRRIFDLAAELTKSATYDEHIIQASAYDSDAQTSLQAYTILCRRLGHTVFTHQVSNVLTKQSFQPYISEISVNVHCVQPRFLKLYARQDLRTSCPIQLRSSLLHLRESKEHFEIDVEVHDAQNRKLMNISSLMLDWEFTAGEKRYSSDSITHRLATEEQIYEGIRLPGRDVLTTTINDVSPNFRIKGTVTHYNERVLAREDIQPEHPPFGIKNLQTGKLIKPTIANEIHIKAVNSTLLPIEHLNIYLSKSSVENIPISQGSGYYELRTSDDGIVTVEYDAAARTLLVKPQRLGNVRIQLFDRCLMSEPSTLSVSVVTIGAITVQAQNLVERTRSIEAIVKLFDSNDNPLKLDASNLKQYELAHTVYDTSEIVSVQLGNQTNLGVGEIRYLIKGNRIGDTKIVFGSGSADKQVLSEPLNIEVFSPIRLYPRDASLIVGSSIQIRHQGGPQPDVNIEYYVHDPKIISINTEIIKALKLGKTKITGRCLAKNPVTGKLEIISEDTIQLHVLALANIEIRVPITRARSGAVLHATIWGQPDLSPMVLGSLGSMQIEWSSDATDVIEIFSVFSDGGIEYDSSDSISVRLRARNPGRANIQANVRLADGSKFKTRAELNVFKMLELQTPKSIRSDLILAAPNSFVQLKCNQDDIFYKPSSENSIVSVSPNGLVRTSDALGRDVIIAKTVDQTLPISIEVKNVQYILVSLVQPSIKLRQPHKKIPRGMQLALQVSLYDNIGNEFSHKLDESNGIKCDLAQKDVVDVVVGNNFTIAVNLARETNNMIAVSLKDNTGVKYAEDYIKLSVAESQHIYPTKTIFSVGDIICFDSPLTSLSSAWSSTNEQIISIDKLTGIARVLSNHHKLGEKIVVTHGVGGAALAAQANSIAGGAFGLGAAFNGFLKYDVEVRDADVIQLLKSFDIFAGTDYAAPLIIRHHLQTDKFSNLIAKNISKCTNSLEKLTAGTELFKCALSSKQDLGKKVLDYYRVAPIFEPTTGRYACHIELIGSFNDVLNTVKTNDVHFELEATLPSGQSDVLSLKFVPGVKVTPAVIEFNNFQEHEVAVSGLDRVLNKVEVKSSNEKFFQVEFLAQTRGTTKYKVTFLQELSVDDVLFVDVSSPETQQKIQIPVVGTLIGSNTCSAHVSLPRLLFMKIWENFGVIFTFFALLVASIYVYIMYCTPNSMVLENPNVFNTTPPSHMSSPCPASQSPMRYMRHSPTSSPYHISSQHTNGGSANSSSIFNQSGLNASHDESFIYGDPRLGTTGRRINHSFL